MYDKLKRVGGGAKLTQPSKTKERKRKMSQKRKIGGRLHPILFVALIALVGVLMAGYSYSYFVNREEVKSFQIIVGGLTYELSSTQFTDNPQVTVLPNQTLVFSINMKSLNEIASRYELYYQITTSLTAEEESKVEVAYSSVSEKVAKGTMEKEDEKEVYIAIRNETGKEIKVLFGMDGGLVPNELVLASDKHSITGEIAYVQDYTASSNYYEWIVPKSASYTIELWGAAGDINGPSVYPETVGKGGYTKGTIYLEKGTPLYFYVGFEGWTFNGGGAGESTGGGATDVRLTKGTWSDFNSLKSRIMVAAGGGGGVYKNPSWSTSNYEGNSPGDAGGLVGYDANYNPPYGNGNSLAGYGYSGYGATQTAGGAPGKQGADTITTTMTGQFGRGGYLLINNGGRSSGGGSGYYGGGHGTHPGGSWPGAGGGSSFISGHKGCNAISASSTATNIVHTNQPNHYSGYVFTNTVMIDGRGYEWTDSKQGYVGIPDATSSNLMAGNPSNGWARVTHQSLIVDQPSSTNPSSPTASSTASYTVSGSIGEGSEITSVTVNGHEATLTGNDWSYDLTLNANVTTTVTIIATDNLGNTITVTRYVIYDTGAPNLTVTAPTSTNSSSPTYTTSASYAIKGTVSDETGIRSVTVNGNAATLSGNNWSYNLGITANKTTTVTIVATDRAGKTTTQTRYLFYDSAAPSLSVTAPNTTLTSATATYAVAGTTTDASGIQNVTVNGVNASLSGSGFSRTISLASGANTVTVIAKDRAGRTTTITRTIYYWNVNNANDMTTFAGNATYINSGLANSTFRSNLWASTTACSKLAASTTAINIIKTNATCKAELTNRINASFNDTINLLNYKVGAKAYLYKDGNQCYNITGGWIVATRTIDCTGGHKCGDNGAGSYNASNLSVILPGMANRWTSYHFRTANVVSVANHSKIVANASMPVFSGDAGLTFGVASLWSERPANGVTTTYRTLTSSPTLLYLGTNASQYYATFGGFAGGSGESLTAYLYQMWIE